MNWQALKTFLIAKSVERSTWLGLITLAGLLGYTIKPEYVEAICMIGTGLGGMILLLTSDAKPATTGVSAEKGVSSLAMVNTITLTVDPALEKLHPGTTAREAARLVQVALDRKKVTL